MWRFLLLFLPIAAVAADSDYLASMIACDEQEEIVVAQTYDAFLTLCGGHDLKPEELRFPKRLATKEGDIIFFERAYYVTPNELRGFGFAVPADCLVEGDGNWISTCSLAVAETQTRQGITSLLLKRSKANKAVDPTPGSAHRDSGGSSEG